MLVLPSKFAFINESCLQQLLSLCLANVVFYFYYFFCICLFEFYCRTEVFLLHYLCTQLFIYIFMDSLILILLHASHYTTIRAFFPLKLPQTWPLGAPLNCLLCSSNTYFRTFPFLSSTIRCSNFLFYFPCLCPRGSHFSKEP